MSANDKRAVTQAQQLAARKFCLERALKLARDSIQTELTNEPDENFKWMCERSIELLAALITRVTDQLHAEIMGLPAAAAGRLQNGAPFEPSPETEAWLDRQQHVIAQQVLAEAATRRR